MKNVFLFTAMMLFGIAASAQSLNGKQKEKELVLLAGMIQPLMLKGGNFEVDFYTKKMVFNYSHGFSLEMNSKAGTTVGGNKEQSLALHLPYSTGFGIGYRLNRYFDIRFEPKLHKFDVYYDGTERKQIENQIANYKTATLGVGTYFRWKPFEKQDNFLRGFTTSTSVRYWQNVWSSLDDNQMDYFNRITGNTKTHKAANIGIANSPIIFNIALGYSISL